jgi:hypothetical protein
MGQACRRRPLGFRNDATQTSVREADSLSDSEAIPDKEGPPHLILKPLLDEGTTRTVGQTRRNTRNSASINLASNLGEPANT